ncbi:MAG: glycosyltransferase 87 family protein [Nocardiaceae bacterium]|nr:glycosyltransferase 87 family protein [Nocardiaceae bacterium]
MATVVLLALGELFPKSLVGRYIGTDLAVYRMGGRVWLDGQDLYGHLPELAGGVPLEFTYPPIAAILFSPLAMVPLHAASVAALAVSTVLLAVIVWTFLGGVRGMTAALGIALLAIVLEPVRTGLGYGQINAVLVAVIAADCLLAPNRKWRGMAVGLVAAIKLTPLVFLLFFLARRDVRGMVNVVAGFVGASILAAVLAWNDTIEYWTRALFDTTRIGPTSYGRNQSLHGEVARLFGDHSRVSSVAWIASSLAVIAAAYVIARKADPQHGLLAVAMCGVLISPISWTHHWIWIVPLLVMLVIDKRWLLVVSGVLIFGVGIPILLSDNRDDWPSWGHLTNSLYVLWTLTYFAGEILHTRQRPTTAS